MMYALYNKMSQEYTKKYIYIFLVHILTFILTFIPEYCFIFFGCHILGTEML